MLWDFIRKRIIYGKGSYRVVEREGGGRGGGGGGGALTWRRVTY